MMSNVFFSRKMNWRDDYSHRDKLTSSNSRLPDQGLRGLLKHRTGDSRFLDAGAGFGVICSAARHMRWKVSALGLTPIEPGMLVKEEHALGPLRSPLGAALSDHIDPRENPQRQLAALLDDSPEQYLSKQWTMPLSDALKDPEFRDFDLIHEHLGALSYGYDPDSPKPTYDLNFSEYSCAIKALFARLAPAGAAYVDASYGLIRSHKEKIPCLFKDSRIDSRCLISPHRVLFVLPGHPWHSKIDCHMRLMGHTRNWMIEYRLLKIMSEWSFEPIDQ